MNILMFCPDWFDYSAGLANSCYALCKQLQQHGHSVRIICAKDKEFRKTDLDVYPIPYMTRLGGRSPIVSGMWGHIEEHVKWGDVVCLFSYMYVMNAQVVGLREKGYFDKPIVHFYRGGLEELHHVPISLKLAKKVYDLSYGKRLFQQVDYTISNAKPVIHLIHESYGVPLEHLKYVKNSLNVQTYSTKERKKNQVIFVGRLVNNKGLKFFERIATTIPKDWSFLIVGQGPGKKQLEHIAKKHTNMRLLGKLSYAQTKDLLATSAIHVLPSLVEGSPRVVMEASASGVPSIAFAVGDVEEMIPKECGFAITPFSIEEFTKRLEELIENKEQRVSMGKAARLFAEKELDWSITYPAIESVLKQVVE